jgi:translation elongation factor EF-Tu-like GTPase
LWGGEIRLNEAETLAPGDAADATFTFLFLQERRPAIRLGATFEIREGARTVGSGVVRELEA